MQVSTVLVVSDSDSNFVMKNDYKQCQILVQETLAAAMKKIMPVLGAFMNDKETKVLYSCLYNIYMYISVVESKAL